MGAARDVPETGGGGWYIQWLVGGPAVVAGICSGCYMQWLVHVVTLMELLHH